MGYVSNPRKVTLDDLKDVALNSTYQLNEGCGIGIDGTQSGSGYATLVNKGFAWPDNGEFEWGGLGDRCGTGGLVSQYGGEYDGASIAGKRGTVKRIAYKADPDTCCTTGASTLDGKTCDPRYRDLGTGSCDNTMAQYCATNPTADRCKTWTTLRKAQAQPAIDAAMRIKCSAGDAIKSSECLSWMSSRGAEVRPWYDQTVASYCKANPTDQDFCGCYNLPKGVDEFAQIANQPYCFVQACANGKNAYKSAAMSGDCASVQICKQTVNIASISDSTISNLQLSCDQNSDTSTTPSPSSPSSPRVLIIVVIIITILALVCGSAVLALLSL